MSRRREGAAGDRGRAFGAAIAVAAALAGCSGEAPDAARAEPKVAGDTNESSSDSGSPVARAVALVSDRHVDDADCARCHRDAARGYERSGMSQTFGPATPERMMEDWDGAHYHHAASDRHYEMFRTADGAYAIRRYQLDADGTRFNLVENEVDWVIGSGAHSRTYVYANDAGELHQFPVAWYGEEERWGMHGGFDVAVHEGFDRRITRDCVGCHNALYDIPVAQDRLGWPHLFPADLPHGIGCQRCHGAGADHVRIADDLDSSEAAVLESIANPPTMPAPLGEDLCFQCHLLPASRMPTRVQRFGRGALSYEVGDPLEAHLVHFAVGDSAVQAQRFEANHHPYRMRLSRCWTESDGALTCFSCHLVHDRPEPDARRAWYRDRCLDCHAEGHAPIPADERPGYLAATADDDCVACHMPRRRATDLVGEVVHDHAILRHAPDRDPTRMIPETGPADGVIAPYLPDRVPEDPELALQLAIARVHQGAPGAVDALLELVRTTRPEHVEPYAHLGPALLAAGRPGEAEAILRRGLELDETLPIAHLELSHALVALGRPAEAEAHLRRALELEPAFPEALVGLGVAAAAQGRVEEAEARLIEALRMRPLHEDAYAKLAQLYTSVGVAPRAAAALERLWAIAPHQDDLLMQLGIAQLYAGRLADAARTFRRGTARRPGDVRLAEAHAAALALEGRHDVALAAVEAARGLPGADEASCLFIEAIAQRGLGALGPAEAARAAALEHFEHAGAGAAGAPPLRNMLRDAVVQLWSGG